MLFGFVLLFISEHELQGKTKVVKVNEYKIIL